LILNEFYVLESLIRDTQCWEHFASAQIKCYIRNRNAFSSHPCYLIINVFAYVRITHGSFCTSLTRPLRSICND